MQMPTVPCHTRGLCFSDRQPDPFVSCLFMELGRRWASDSGAFRLDMTRIGMESLHRVADDITWWIRSANGLKNPWSKHCETTSDFSPSSSPMSMVSLNRSSLLTVTIRSERERRRRQRALRFFLVGETLGAVRSSKKTISMVPLTSTSPRMDIIPSDSADRTYQGSLTIIPPTHLYFPH